MRSIRRTTMPCSSRSLALRSSCSPRWSSTAGSALRRVEPASATVAATAPERRTSSSGLAPRKAASGVPKQKQKQDGKSSRRAPSMRGRVVGGRRLDGHLAGQHDLVEPGSSGCARPPPPRSARSARAGPPEIRRGGARVRIGRGERRRAQRAEPALPAARAPLPESRSAPGSTRERSGSERPSLRTQRDLGHHQQRGRQRGPDAAPSPPSGAKAKPAGPDRAGAGGQAARLLGDPVAGHPGAALGQVAGSDPSPRATTSCGRAERRRARSRPVGLLPAEPAIARPGGTRRRSRPDPGRGRPRAWP